MTAHGEVRPASTRAAPWRTGALLLTAVAADVVVDPARTHIPLCPFHALTGLQCPLCGALRAVDEVSRAHVGTALRDNVLVVLAIPVVLAVWVTWLRRARTGRARPGWPRGATVTLVALAVCFTLVRNLPFAAGLRP